MKYLHQLKNLGLPKGEFVIFGSGPLAIRGIRENHDIDILVTESLWKKFAKHYAVKRTKRGEKIQIKDIEIIPIDYEDWSPEIKSPQEVLEKAEII